MSEPHRESLRNVVLISSAGAGKTSLAEAILFAAGTVPHLGSIAQGTTVSDFEPEELHRRSSVSTSLLRCSWNHTTINLVDPPGALSLLGETVMALRAVDAVILVVGASSGIRSELVRIWARVTTLGLPCLLFLNEMDKDGVSLDEIGAMCQRELGIMPLPRCRCPIGSGAQLKGVLDLVQQRVITSRTESPTIQQVVNTGDRSRPWSLMHGSAFKRGWPNVMIDYWNNILLVGELTQEDLTNGFVLASRPARLSRFTADPLPENIGIVPLLDAIVDLIAIAVERATEGSVGRACILIQAKP